MNILTMIPLLLLFSHVLPVIKATFTIPNVVIENSMACHVFCNIKLGKAHGAALDKAKIAGGSSSMPIDVDLL